MILSLIFFLVLFLGGIWLLGFAQTIPDFQGLVFIIGLLVISLSLGFLMRQRGSATRRDDNWSGNATE